MKIYLIRHGETTGDIENRYGGDFEDHLSEKGTKQSHELAKKLASDVGDIVTVEGVVKYFDFKDPWNNRLSYVQLM